MNRILASIILVILSVLTSFQPVQADSPPQINYPSGMSDQQKLSEVYSLIEQMRLEHNRVGTIANSNWRVNQYKWAQYSQIYTTKLLPLIQEENRLKAAIIKNTQPPSELSAKPIKKKPISPIRPNNPKRPTIPDIPSVQPSVKLPIQTNITTSSTLFGNMSLLKTHKSSTTYSGLNQLRDLNFNSLHGQFIDPVENYNTYSKVDSGGYFSITSNKVTATNIPGTVISYVYRDYGANFFNNFTHLFTYHTDSIPIDSAQLIYSIGNEYGTASSLASNTDGISIVTFTQPAWTGAAGQDYIYSQSYDGTYIYAGTNTAPSQVIKIDPLTMTTVGLPWTGAAGQDYIISQSYDGTYIYAGTGTAPGQVIKIDPSTMTTLPIPYLALGNIGGSVADYLFPFTDNATYYPKIIRNSGIATLYLYTDINRTSLLDTLTITCELGSWRYLQPSASWEVPSLSGITSWYVQNLDLQLPQPPTPTPTPTPAQKTDTFFKTMVKIAITLGIVFFLFKYPDKEPKEFFKIAIASAILGSIIIIMIDILF